VVIDNDADLSAHAVVHDFSSSSALTVNHGNERRQNISLARNMAVEKARGKFIAFIDDDEFPTDTWLLNLYNAFNTLKPTGGILGPVLPHYPEGTPKWLIKSGICERPQHPTGTLLNWNMTRTGNVLLLREILTESQLLFDPKYGRTGGEDKELFRLLMLRGYTFLWCQDAVVYEEVYEDRWQLSHYVYRNLMNGGVTGESRKYSLSYFGRSSASLLYYTLLLAFSLFLGKHVVYKHSIRLLYDFGRVLGCLGN
jgi:cellulose synthase/poly-beta-1,6-N-acetylglucosamine synthase-like glycosyltransferase